MLFNQVPHEQSSDVRAESSSTMQNSKPQDSTFRPLVIYEIRGNARNNGVNDALKQLELAEHRYRTDLEKLSCKRGISLLPPLEVTIYSDEKLRESAVLDVPLQLKYTGTSPVIPSSLADTPCVALGIEGMLCYLNEIMRTAYTADLPGLLPLLQTFIDHNFDFGLAFGHLRAHWYRDFGSLQARLAEREARDNQMRAAAMDPTGLFIEKYLPPRRVWDLCSNRVLPWWVFQRDLSEDEDDADNKEDDAEDEDSEDDRDDDDDGDDDDEEDDDDDGEECTGGMGLEVHPATRFRLSGSCFGLRKPGVVSHSWLAENLRHSVSTPINSFTWPVPIPIDTTLDRVRVELLNHGTDIVWLDVLCLRQERSPELEALRVEEWKIDVPTIGSMYLLNAKEGNFASLTTYYNGLGRPFRIDHIPLEDKRCYLYRAWTLQEFNGYGTIGGLAPYSPLLPSIQEADMLFAKDPHLKRFYMCLQRASDQLSRIEDGCNIFFILAALASRNVTHATDGVGAIASLLTERHTPIYIRHDGSSAVEEAWVLLTQAMPSHRAAELFFMFPTAGDGAYAWCPSWQQAIQHSIPLSAEVIPRSEVHCVQRGLASRFQFMGPALTGVLVQGLAEPDPCGQSRSGMLVIDVEGITHSFKVTVSHQLPIAENRYTLLGNVGSAKGYHDLLSTRWVIGWATSSGVFQKIGTLTIDWSELTRLDKLHIIERKVVDLA